MSVRELTYEEALQLFVKANGAGEFARFESAYNAWGVEVGTEEIVDVLKSQGVVDSKWVAVGNGNVCANLNSSGNIAGYSAEFEASYPSVINSNVQTRGTIRTPINTTATIVEERSVMSAKVGLREAGTFAIGSVVPAIMATGMGITLGKTVDSALYNLNPDFWDSHGMSTLDPTTWNSITSDYDGVAGTLFDAIFGLNSDGTTQAYIDEDAAAYLAWWMSTQGVFTSQQTTTANDYESTIGAALNNPDIIPATGEQIAILKSPLINNKYYYFYTTSNPITYTYYTDNTETSKSTILVSTSPFKYGMSNARPNEVPSPPSSWSDAASRTIGETTYYYTTWSRTNETSYVNHYYYERNEATRCDDVAKTLLFNNKATTTGSVPGIGTQSGATTPTTTGWSDVPSTKQSLQQQYPQLWDGAKHQDYVDENGQNRSKTLIPINLPNANNPFDTQPTSGNRNQQDPLVDPTTATEDLLKTITDTITKLIDMIPTDTGSGDSPVVPVPAGSASSLWKIYNPTQAQVDAFGAWLWDSSFVEQIKKLFNDPMQAIIGIHKVFATPSIGGQATIKVGYLDSEVPSNWVDNQYTTIDCGTVKLYEEFGNVFDYSPYTRVSLYLPFIGIVDLNIADVMRASISVKYHVDVLSGACLADVIVNRDSAGGVLYQYSGSAIVTYPVSSGNYMGMVAGVLSIAGGIAGTIMTGGALAPALMGGAAGMSHLHTNVSHSGSFSGCAGAMAGKKPYLIVSRPQPHMADNFKHFTGLPANAHVKLDDCEGFVRVKSVYVTTSSKSTDEEKEMIEAKLKEGVLI